MTAPLERALKTWEAARGIPSWRDRFDLRRRFRRTARAAMSERQAEMTAVLRHLSEGNVTLVDVVPGTRREDKIVEFADGTRLLLGIRRDGDALDRLDARHCAWLEEVQPCFGKRWFWLSFTSPDHPVPVDVLTTVSPAPSLD